MSVLRKNFCITKEEDLIINDFCKKTGRTISDLIRTATLEYIKAAEKIELGEFLKAACLNVRESEQKDLKKVLKKYESDKDNSGREIDANELL